MNVTIASRFLYALCCITGTVAIDSKFLNALASINKGVFGVFRQMLRDPVTYAIINAFLVVISNAIDFKGYTLESLYWVLQSRNGQESFAQVIIWCIGQELNPCLHKYNGDFCN